MNMHLHAEETSQRRHKNKELPPLEYSRLFMRHQVFELFQGYTARHGSTAGLQTPQCPAVVTGLRVDDEFVRDY